MDGDGYVAVAGRYDIFCGDPLPRGYATKVGDCDDQDSSRNPGAPEVCDDQDNDCDGSVDEGIGTRWYLDRDRDGFGDPIARPITSCRQPSTPEGSNYVENATDCMDQNPQIYPRENFAETRCDGVDEDCDGSVDDGFAWKGAACSDPCPGGVFVCNATRDGLACEGSPQPVGAYYPDLDRDGAGSDSAASVALCPNEPVPPTYSQNQGDCDDQDPHNYRGKTEICDARDNDCDTARDEGFVCEGKGWRELNDSALTGRAWKTVALAQNGWVWLAGAGGSLAVRKFPSLSFSNLNEQCGTTPWNAAWARSDGAVFLVGDGGWIAWHDGSSCRGYMTVESQSPLTGITGRSAGGTTRLYAVNSAGMLYTWTTSSLATRMFDVDVSVLASVHALDNATRMLAVGGTNELDPLKVDPFIADYPGTGGAEQVSVHGVSGVSSPYGGSLRAVWMVSPDMAYAVGDKGLVLKWNGAKAWSRLSPPADNSSAPFSSVVAPDASSVYVTDTAGRIRHLKPSGWVSTPLYSSARPFRDIASIAVGDIWAVGDNGLVVHFPE
ncbi:MopE-related protein [Stigmatella sp. ncwal1]|uniref:MopE-related protein n=1 Tax=Stigmatella ashevillensis TaxID=2995309 RepID=A0ABT5DG90_9BACT|nr:MopE-related protein [Stigmatella ashevillena]MDC0711798.1 MopE-related protein [Stigmatella ashevillena]